MRFLTSILIVLALMALATVVSADTEQDVIDQYLNKRQPKIQEKAGRLGWLSMNFTLNRVNRHNDYNHLMTLESDNISGGSFSWLNMAYSVGGELGILFSKRFCFSLGGEYWLKMGEELEGDYAYLPTSTTITNPSSSVKVYGAYAGIGWFAVNPPKQGSQPDSWSFRVNGTAGFYVADWELWQDFVDLNLATGLSSGSSATFRGTAPGFTIGGVVEYPVSVLGLVASGELQYLYLNFDNVAWYNSSDEEIIVTWDGSSDGRVDLGLSGFRGKFEVRKYFNW